MAADYKRYLAENVLNEKRTVTYRLLSRALKIHSNLAKQMLFDFHRTENAKRPKSVSATYLICGVQASEKKTTENGISNDEDVPMRSSPPMSSMPQPDETEQPTQVTTFVLAKEEDLEGAKASFESISMIHVYSLQANALQDLNALVDVSREILSSYGHEDPLEHGKHWGMIQNEHVKRRKATRPPPPAAAPAPAAPKPSSTTQEPSQKSDSDQGTTSKPPPPQKSEGKAEKPAPQRKKGDLFSSFAKTKPKAKTGSAAGAEAAKKDSSTSGMFDGGDADEGEDGDVFANSGEDKNTSTRESRKEREARLKQMMEDDDDEEMPDAESAEEQEAELEPEPEPEPEPEAKPEPEEPKHEVTVSNGRRRGKRKVMKKKTKKDEEGYLVTVEEPVWESFSEDEPAAPPKKKPALSSTGSKGKKAGQGNIMSFFSKK